jgi:hypothetical protein
MASTFDGWVREQEFRYEKVIPRGRDFEDFVGAKRVFVASQDAHQKLQLWVDGENP